VKTSLPWVFLAAAFVLVQQLVLVSHAEKRSAERTEQFVEFAKLTNKTNAERDKLIEALVTRIETLEAEGGADWKRQCATYLQAWQDQRMGPKDEAP